jgi:hypothetical protein
MQNENTTNKKVAPIEDDMKVRGVGALRSATNGWKQMQKGAAPSRQERILRESKGDIADDYSGFRPGFDDDAPSERVSTKDLQDRQKTMAPVKTFTGTPQQIITKMKLLFENNKNTVIVNVEEAGFVNYKLSFR